MSRIQHPIELGCRIARGKIALRLIGVAVACIALHSQAQVTTPAPAIIAPRDGNTAPVPADARGSVLVMHAALAPVRIDVVDTPTAFALVRKDGKSISSSASTDDIAAIQAARARLRCDFLWFRHGGRAYVVVDPMTVARARDAWRDVENIDPRMGALGKQVEGHDTDREQLGAKMEALPARHHATPAMEETASRMARIGLQQQAVATQQARISVEMTDANEVQLEKLQARMDALTERMDTLIGQMDEQNEVLEAQTGQLEACQQPMEPINDHMEEASRPIKALGEQMEALGEQQEKRARIAKRELQKLIDTALEQGLAKPEPDRAGNL